MHARGELHPTVGNKYPERRDVRPYSRKPRCRKVKPLAYFVPAKEHNGNKRGLHEECHYTFYGERRTKNIAHKPRIITPVCTELEFEYQPRSYTNGKIYSEESHPELGSLLPLFVARAYVERFHERNNKRKP